LTGGYADAFRNMVTSACVGLPIVVLESAKIEFVGGTS